jgi:eukaryotic-like serine/threonine-protein kinase
VIGQVVGKYRIAEKIGEGGVGAVYRAEHIMLGSPAAIKILLPRWTTNRQVVDRFFTEARAAGAIHHVGIVQVFDAGRLPSGQAFIAMELLLGIGLGDLIAEQGALPPRLAVAIGGQILAALDAVHVAGVIHRDLKPDNVQLVRDASAPEGMRAKLLDFGIAKLLSGEGKRAPTRSGALLGTPHYMSPEQCAGRPVDLRSDLYSVGCILFEMLTGRMLFDGPVSADLVAMHLHAPAPRLREIDPTLPEELEQLLSRMLAKDPERRTPSAAWALATLERASLEPSATTPSSTQLGPRTRGPFRVDTSSETALFQPLERDFTEPQAIGLEVTELGFKAPEKDTERRPRRWVPLLVIGVALIIAVAAGILIGHSAELPP